MIAAWLAWALAQAPATGPTDVHLVTRAFVGATISVGGRQLVLPNTTTLAAGEHEARLVTTSGQVIVKRIAVAAPSAHPQVIMLDEAPAASVPGHRFRFVVRAGDGHTLFVDGAEAGPTPIEVVLAPGPHQLVIVSPDGTRTERTVDLRAGSGDLTTVTL